MQYPTDFNTLTDAERQAVIADLRNAEQDAIRQQEADQTTTVIHKIAINDGRITYVAQGEVPGTLDNQFSMDEYNNDLRLATTSSIYTPPASTRTTTSLSSTGTWQRSAP